MVESKVRSLDNLCERRPNYLVNDEGSCLFLGKFRDIYTSQLVDA